MNLIIADRDSARPRDVVIRFREYPSVVTQQMRISEAFISVIGKVIGGSGTATGAHSYTLKEIHSVIGA